MSARREGQCSEISYNGRWPGDCPRAAVEDGMCRSHLAGKRRRDARIADQQARWADEAARRAFVNAWRDQHPRGTWGDIWQCPLCGQAIQTTIESAQYQQYDIKRHQHEHGADWTAYEAIGAGDGGAT